MAKIKYKRVEFRCSVKDIDNRINEHIERGWDVFWYWERVESPTDVLVRMVLKKTTKSIL
jgi:hypothetical protein